jgi:hypothetical protein
VHHDHKVSNPTANQSIPPTEQLNKLNTGYKEHTTKVPHLLYMDGWKLIGKREEEFQKQMQTVTPSVMTSTGNFDLTSAQRLY